MTIDDVLAAARARLRRLDPAEAARAAGNGARLVDTRPQFQRQADGEVPGAIVIERVHLEWRLDPTSAGRIPEAAGYHVAWIVLCDEGYSSSLAGSLPAIAGPAHRHRRHRRFPRLEERRSSRDDSHHADSPPAEPARYSPRRLGW